VIVEAGHYGLFSYLTEHFANIPAALPSPTWTKPSSSNSTKPRSCSVALGIVRAFKNQREAENAAAR
jgi:hypothetical protein